MVLLHVVKVLIVISYTSAFFLNLRQLGNDLEKKYNLEFLKDYVKFPVYINPHPHCALEDEGCTLDTNCCGGFECKLAVDRGGVKSTCQRKVVGDNVTEAGMEGGEEEEEEEWDQDWQEGDNSNSLLEEIYKTRLDKLNKEEEQLFDDQYYMIKELQKPLSFDDMRELQQVKEIEDYKREHELEELRRWAESKKAEEDQKRETENRLKNLAIERVSKVLKEEEKQKLEIFKEIQDKMKKKHSWF